MSKVKKIVSVLLAAVMVLSASPLSFAYLDGYVEGTDYVYNTTSSVTNPTQIWADTYGFSEIIRIADATNHCLNGNTIVRANKSGVAEVTQSFVNFAHGCEAPTDYTLKMVIHGITDPATIGNISISVNGITGLGSLSASKSYSSSEGGVVVTWDGSQLIGKTTNGEGNIIWNITFSYSGKEYSTHAYSYAKYVVRPNGLLTYIYCKPLIGSINGRTCVLSQLYCGQSVPGFYSATPNKGSKCYLNNNTAANDGEALSGCGKDDTGNGTYAVKSDAGGMIARNWDFTSTNGEKDCGSFSHGLDGDRVQTSVYIDKSYDHLGTGNLTFNGKTLTNGLNMRLCFKPGEYSKFWSFGLQSVGVYARNQGNQDACLSQNSVTSAGSTTAGTWTCNVTGKVDLVNGTYNPGEYLNDRAADGTGGFVQDYDVSQNPNFIMVPFGGSGALTDGTVWELYYTVQNNMNDRAKNKLESDRRAKFTAWMSVKFNTYDTAQLRTVLNAITEGSGGTITVGGVTSNFIKGKFPQSWMYTSGWSNFETALNNARMLIARFDVTQTQITNATTALLTAYNNLGGYVESGTFQVKHCLKNTTTELVPAQTFYKTGVWTGNGSTSGNDTIKSGASFTVKALVDNGGNCTLKGYKVSGVSTVTGTVSFTSTGASIMDENNTSLGNCVTFYYEPANINLKVHTGIYSTGDNPQEYIYTTAVTNGLNLDSSSSTPNFATIKNQVTTTYAANVPAHTTYAGMYESAAYSGSPIDGINVSGGASTWNMPNTEKHVYIKWNANPVKLRVVTSYGSTVTDIAGAITPSMAAQTYQMGNVTFNEPSAPPSQAGWSFVNYYTDSTYSTPVTWPVTASYSGSQAYTITDGGDGYGYVTVYAKYVDRSNKIIFDPQGGTIADGTQVGAFTVNNNELNFAGASLPASIGYPTPVREGYIFTGWVLDLANKTPVQGWTVTDGTSETGVSPVMNGVHGQNNTTGFVCYATWKAAPILVTFKLNIPSSETAAINSTNIPGTDFYYQYGAQADTPIDTSLFPSAPRRYGYEFKGWQYQGLSLGEKYDVVDMELTANWERADKTAFAELTSYVTLAGQDEIVDIQHDEANVENPTAQKGDVVKVRLSVAGNFYAGSSSFIFAYDADFFQAVSGVTASVNDNNGYISAIYADVTEINGATAYAAYDGMMDKTGGKVVDPGTGAQITNPAYIQVTIDPDVTQMTNGYKTVSFSDPTYIIELVLKIKSNTTKQTASVWMPDELVRSGDNIMGDTYIAYSAGELSLSYVKTDEVKFDKEPVSTVKTQPDPRPTTSITLALPKDASNNALGQFADGRTAAKTFVGPEGTEILSTFTTDYATYNETGSGTNVIGFPEPTRTGYHINGWNKTAGSGSAATWDSYSFANADQNGNTYTVNWEADAHTLTFYKDDTCDTVEFTKAVVFDQVGGITFTASQPRYNQGQYKFKGFIPKGMAAAEANIVNWDTYQVTGDAEFYPWYVAAEKDLKIRPYYETTDAETGEIVKNYFSTTTSNQTLTISHADLMALDVPVDVSYGYTIIIAADADVPAVSTWPEYTYYLKASDLDAFIDANSSFTSTLRTNYNVKTSAPDLPLTLIIGQTAATNDIKMEGAPVTVTFKAGSVQINGAATPVEYNGPYTATLENGQYTWTITGKYGTTYDFLAATAGVVEPFGYTKQTAAAYANGFSNGAKAGTYQVVTHTATWVGANVNTHWLYKDGTEAKTLSAMRFNSNYAVKTNGPTTAVMEADNPGYTFSGWVVADPTTHQAINDTLVTNYNASANPTTNIKRTVDATTGASTYDIYFVPKYTPKSYNVIYKTSYTDIANSETQYGSAQSKEYGSTVTVNGDASAVTGYTFDGWYNEGTYANKTTKVTSFTMGAEAKTLYGYYVPNTYKVRFYNNDGTDAYTDVDNTFNASIVAPATNPTRSGYRFMGWAATSTATTADVITNYGKLTTAGDAAVKFYAVWEVNDVSYYVDYYYEDVTTGNYVKDDTLTLTYTGTVGTSVQVSAEDKSRNDRTGYTLSTEDSLLEAVVPSSSELRFAVKYKLNVWTLIQDVDGAVAPVAEYKYGATIAPVDAASKVGYRFDGWNNMPADGKMPNNNVVITAAFTIEQYTVKFDKNYPGCTNDIANISATYNNTITMPTPAREGYQFDGWFTAAEGGTQYTSSTVFTDLGDYGAELQLYAHWTVLNNKIIFHNTGDSTIAPVYHNFGDVIDDVPTPTKTGYTFGGWYLDETYSGSAYVFTTMPENDLDVYGKWTIETYTVSFDKNYTGAVNDIANIPATFGSTITMPTVSREGYDFLGWFDTDAAEGGVQYTDVKVFEDLGVAGTELKLYARWDIKEYTISFYVNGGSAVSDITEDYGTAITAPEAPTKTGYTFGGWYKDPEFGGSAYEFTTMPAENIDLYAKWNVNSYTISFEENGGSTVSDITKNYGASVTAPTAPTKAGYDFGGWYENENLSGSKYVFTTMPAENFTLYAKWDIHTYTVDFNMNGGAPQAASKTAQFNETITLPAAGTDFTKAGYEFGGWFDNAGCTGDSVGTASYTLPAQAANNDHITLYAKWIIKENTISFNSNGGNAVTSITQEYNTNVTAPTAPEKAGYDFDGWYENEDLSGSRYVFTTMPAESITLYAKWKEHEYTVVYLQPDDYVTYETEYAADITYNDKDAFSIDYVDYNSNMTIPAGQPDIAYYDFIGWVDSLGVVITNDSTMPAASQSGAYYVYPSYQKIEVTIGEIVDENAEIVENDVPPVDGYIYNAGNQKTKAQIKAMFQPTGYSDIIVTPLKGKYCGTGTKVEIVDLSKAANEEGYVVETYYMIVCGDVTGDAISRSNDLEIVEEMLALEESARDWYVKETVEDAEELCICFTLAADVNGDGIFNNDDAADIELFVYGIKEYDFNGEDKKYITIYKA